MVMQLIESVANSRADVTRDALDVGGAGTLTVYTGPRPADVSDAPTGTPLATFTLPSPVAPNATSRGSTWNSIVSTAVIADGMAVWFRTFQNGGGTVFDGSVGVTGSGADLEFDDINFVLGALVSIDSFLVLEVSL